MLGRCMYTPDKCMSTSGKGVSPPDQPVLKRAKAFFMISWFRWRSSLSLMFSSFTGVWGFPYTNLHLGFSSFLPFLPHRPLVLSRSLLLSFFHVIFVRSPPL